MKKPETKAAEDAARKMAEAMQHNSDAINTIALALKRVFPFLAREKRRNLAARAVRQQERKTKGDN